jgi:hypothetical protein
MSIGLGNYPQVKPRVDVVLPFYDEDRVCYDEVSGVV